MPLVNKIIDMLSLLANYHNVIVLVGKNSRKCFFPEKQIRRTHSALVNSMLPTIASATSNSAVLLSEILYQLNDEEKKKIVEITMKIFLAAQLHQDIDYAIMAAYNVRNKELRKKLLNNLISLIESEAKYTFVHE
ncbi:unnamed protein product [Clavelina lepadiformis]|uniref:Uncharacterized protein n=1 Tax=Clavelina lepadiformis TaxID=159417 RepID=A0ABP0F1F1_CLALP